jgi:hypothetical protein
LTSLTQHTYCCYDTFLVRDRSLFWPVRHCTLTEVTISYCHYGTLLNKDRSLFCTVRHCTLTGERYHIVTTTRFLLQTEAYFDQSDTAHRRTISYCYYDMFPITDRSLLTSPTLRTCVERCHTPTNTHLIPDQSVTEHLWVADTVTTIHRLHTYSYNHKRVLTSPSLNTVPHGHTKSLDYINIVKDWNSIQEPHSQWYPCKMFQILRSSCRYGQTDLTVSASFLAYSIRHYTEHFWVHMKPTNDE